MVELNNLFQKDQGKTASVARGTVELNRLFQKDRGNIASGARILSPNPRQRLLINPSSMLRSNTALKFRGSTAHCSVDEKFEILS